MCAALCCTADGTGQPEDAEKPKRFLAAAAVLGLAVFLPAACAFAYGETGVPETYTVCGSGKFSSRGTDFLMLALEDGDGNRYAVSVTAAVPETGKKLPAPAPKDAENAAEKYGAGGTYIPLIADVRESTDPAETGYSTVTAGRGRGSVSAYALLGKETWKAYRETAEN